MEKLPEELTPELLSLVLDKEIFTCGLWIDNQITYGTPMRTKDKLKDNFINIDTLTRLMKEWCREQGCTVCKSCFNDEDGYDMEIYYGWEMCATVGKSEFEAVLKATHWVAKEKGSIK